MKTIYLKNYRIINLIHCVFNLSAGQK